MALYVAIVLWAAIVALPQGDEPDDRLVAIGVVWGSAAGLALAHVFAFGLSSRLLAEERDAASDRMAAIWQIVAALAVAAVVTIPLLVVGPDRRFDVVLWLLAAMIGITGFAAARRSGATLGRALLTAAGVLLVALLVVALKLILGH